MVIKEDTNPKKIESHFNLKINVVGKLIYQKHLLEMKRHPNVHQSEIEFENAPEIYPNTDTNNNTNPIQANLMDIDEFVYDTDGYEYDDAHDYNYEESTTESTTDEENTEEPNHVQFNIRRTPMTLRCCFVCKKDCSNDLCYQLTNFTYQEFFLLNTMLKSLRNSPTRTKEQALAVYLFWLKRGLSQNILALYFGLTNRKAIQKYCHSVRTALTKDFVPKYLGASSITRKCWILQNTDLIRDLYDLDDDQLADVKTNNLKFNLKPWFIAHFNLFRAVLTCFEP